MLREEEKVKMIQMQPVRSWILTVSAGKMSSERA